MLLGSRLKSILLRALGKVPRSSDMQQRVNLKYTKTVEYLHHNQLKSRLDFSWLVYKFDEYQRNCIRRDERERFDHTISLINKLTALIDSKSVEQSTAKRLVAEIEQNAFWLPNWTHTQSPNYEESKNGKVIYQPSRSIEPTISFEEISGRCDALSLTNMGYFSTRQSYCIHDDLVLLEFALLNYAMDIVKSEGFKPVEMADTVETSVLEACGFPLKSCSGSSAAFVIDESDNIEALSGTSEMCIAHYVSTLKISEDTLPLLFTSLTRCFRPEISGSDPRGCLYRVHEFNKVEMFAVCKNSVQASDDLQYEMCKLQIKIFSDLGLCIRVLDMPTHDLGLSAYRKYDIEALFPSSGRLGEISSCSNCTDFQSRRLGIKYSTSNSGFEYAHTINATAMASSRVLMALVEQYYSEEEQLMKVPDMLIPYIGRSTILNTKPKSKKFFVKLLANPTGYGSVTYEQTHQKRLEGKSARKQLLLSQKNEN